MCVCVHAFCVGFLFEFAIITQDRELGTPASPAVLLCPRARLLCACACVYVNFVYYYVCSIFIVVFSIQNQCNARIPTNLPTSRLILQSPRLLLRGVSTVVRTAGSANKFDYHYFNYSKGGDTDLIYSTVAYTQSFVPSSM